MAKKARTTSEIQSRDIFPMTEERVVELIPDLAWAIARAAAATVLADRVLTVAEYEAIAESATALESLSSYPGLMSYLVLRALEESPELGKALKELRKTTQGLPPETRQAVFDATFGVRLAQGENAPKMHAQWARALQAEDTSTRGPDEEKTTVSTKDLIESGQAQLSNTWRRLTELRSVVHPQVIDRARVMARTFQDDDLQKAISTCEASSDPQRDTKLTSALESAVERAADAAIQQLKTTDDLAQQQDLADRFLKTTDALIDQVQSRLVSVEQRLQLQGQMFSEDLESFIENSLESLELMMNRLAEGRHDWGDVGFWESFKNDHAFGELTSRLQPLRDRYTRIFEQWRMEIEAFSHESATIRSTVLSTVDMRAFGALVPSKRSTASLKCALDRVSDTTLSLSLLGVLAAGAAAAAGVVQVATVVAAIANPIGATVGAAVGIAAIWNLASNREARKEKMIRTKREQIKAALERLLKGEGLNHDELANEVLTKFVEVAVEQYTPMLVEARLWSMKARLEQTVIQRVLQDTRAFLTQAAR